MNESFCTVFKLLLFTIFPFFSFCHKTPYFLFALARKASFPFSILVFTLDVRSSTVFCQNRLFREERDFLPLPRDLRGDLIFNVFLTLRLALSKKDRNGAVIILNNVDINQQTSFKSDVNSHQNAPTTQRMILAAHGT